MTAWRDLRADDYDHDSEYVCETGYRRAWRR
jgi:hypothetical protein